MSEDFSAIVPREHHPGFAWLGKLDWLRVEALEVPGELPETLLSLRNEVLAEAPGADKHGAFVRRLQNVPRNQLLPFDMFAEVLGNGPKRFVPSAEQFESMRHVSIDLPISEFRSPFPALVIRMPEVYRRKMADEFEMTLDESPAQMIVRYRKATPTLGAIVATHASYGETEIVNMFRDRPGITIEEALCRWTPNKNDHGHSELHHKYHWQFARAALNLCLMLTHYGCNIAGPAYPEEYARHRTKKKNLSHLCHGDYLAIQMTQDITVRRSEDKGGDGKGGYEVAPHWVRGHWRRKPGWEKFWERNEQPPLTFVRPYLVRRDRIVGDIGDSTYTIRG